MKVKTAVGIVARELGAGNYEKAAALLKKYQRKYGHRHFKYWTRTLIKNGLYYGV